ncbi:Hemin import ATP-binding protein HmuV [Chlamydiales bacterium SCGC AB-751-O23]|jgi:ABC-type cobalamin/Fe3+-siderophores transport system ATPase subunit|nr:Hemin import ATP-binding protein HmuV [Chlamydiales bacterium SCGC AB-751-O23]
MSAKEVFMLEAKNINHFISEKEILKKVTLSFSKGFIYGVFGPNGSGKTTLLKALGGLSKPSSGSILWNQNCLYKLPPKKRSKLISLVPQYSKMCFDFSLWEFIAMGLYPSDISDSSLLGKERISSVIEQMNLSNFKNRSVLTLSAGELKRAYLARALVSQSSVLLLDEPSTFLDLKHQEIIWKLLTEIAKMNKIVIVATHDLHMAKYFCDDVIVLKNGKCFAQGKYNQVMQKNVLKNVFDVSSLDGSFR